MTFPKFCKDCAHSQITTESWSSLRCVHPVVNSKDSWALSHLSSNGSECRTERDKTSWFAKCGQKGKLYAPRTN